MSSLRFFFGVWVFVGLVAFSSVATAGSKPNTFWMDREEKPGICYGNSHHLYARSKLIGYAHLSISNFESESDDVEELGVEVKRSDGLGLDIYEEFLKSIREHNPALDFRPELEVDADKKRQECLDNSRNSKEDFFIRYQKCRAESSAFISSVYGNAITQFFCNVKIKDKRFPILAYTGCSINIGSKFEYRGENARELTDIRAFEPSSVKQGLVRMLDQHVEELSKIFELVKRCR
mgnify:FL=1